MSQLFYQPKVRVSQLLCGLLLLTTCYTALGQSPPPTTGPRPINLTEPDQIKQSEGSTIALKFTWDLDPPLLQFVHDYEIECAADIDGQRNSHTRVGSEVATSITIWRLNVNQDYICCITVEMINETKLMDCKSVHTDTVKQLSSTAAIATIAVAVVLVVVMTIVCVVLCIVVYKRRIKNVR